VKNKQK